MSYDPEYSKANPPSSCVECHHYEITYSPAHPDRRTLFYDKCGLLNCYFAKMHIVLRGEYRPLSKHDRDDLSKALPYECPFYSAARSYWESPGVIKMGKDWFIYEMETHGDNYKGWYIYALKTVNNELKDIIPDYYELTYLDVLPEDEDWFIETFGEQEIIASPIPPPS